MMDRQKGQIIFECDSCDETLETETNDLAEANACRKREGWGASQIGNDWIHACPKHVGVR